MKPEPKISIGPRDFDSRALLICATFSGLDYADVIALVAFILRGVLDKNPLPKEARRIFRFFWKKSKGHENEVPFACLPKSLADRLKHEDCSTCADAERCRSVEAEMLKTPRTVH